MIKNAVFDLGNVLISFSPAEYLLNKNYPLNIRKTILADVFASDEWLKLDRGEITTGEAIDSIAGKSSLSRAEIAVVFDFRTDIMFPIDSNVKILPELKKLGLKLYYLSNFPIDIFEQISSDYYFFRYFDGGIISSEVKVSKPDVAIYEILMKQYSLKADECLYIDDIEINVTAAQNAGMKGFTTFGNQDIGNTILGLLK